MYQLLLEMGSGPVLEESSYEQSLKRQEFAGFLWILSKYINRKEWKKAELERQLRRKDGQKEAKYNYFRKSKVKMYKKMENGRKQVDTEKKGNDKWKERRNDTVIKEQHWEGRDRWKAGRKENEMWLLDVFYLLMASGQIILFHVCISCELYRWVFIIYKSMTHDFCMLNVVT